MADALASAAKFSSCCCDSRPRDRIAIVVGADGADACILEVTEAIICIQCRTLDQMEAEPFADAGGRIATYTLDRVGQRVASWCPFGVHFLRGTNRLDGIIENKETDGKYLTRRVLHGIMNQDKKLGKGSGSNPPLSAIDLWFSLLAIV